MSKKNKRKYLPTEGYTVRYTYLNSEGYARKSEEDIRIELSNNMMDKCNHDFAEKLFLNSAKERGIKVLSVDCVIYH